MVHEITHQRSDISSLRCYWVDDTFLIFRLLPMADPIIST